jgi:hypothetical protein
MPITDRLQPVPLAMLGGIVGLIPARDRASGIFALED